ncbi:cation:dicarboxylase symporter family transporter [bacterium]|nr:cation:dicarboxylase symporter family transporter [bacterium]
MDQTLAAKQNKNQDTATEKRRRKSFLRRLSTSHQILIGLGAGIGAGIFFGEQISFLNWPAKVFISLLQVTVLPYIVGSSYLQLRHTGSSAMLSLLRFYV